MYIISNQDFSIIRRPWCDLGSGRENIAFDSIFWYPGVYVRPAAVNIFSFNLRNPLTSTKKIVTVCIESVNVLYMSENYIYLTNYLLQKGVEYTVIRKIFVCGECIKPFADGRVLGVVSSQFSLDEYGQFLRIATTTGSGTASSNCLFVLNYFLKAYGTLTNIARKERIYSVRYVGLRCYIVTFLQVDPFFVISLANHKKPAILGQLKVPGFSRYLHPYDENTIIGLGRQTDKYGRQLGLKIGLFDVTDATRPRQSVVMQI